MVLLKYQGCSVFRQRVCSSLLSHNPLIITNIRPHEASSSGDGTMILGIQDFEASFLRLIEKITDGCIIEINETGTSVKLKPGILMGGKITHDCGLSRSIGWFVEGILPLAMFCKNPLQLSLTGITNDAMDFSVVSTVPADALSLTLYLSTSLSLCLSVSLSLCLSVSLSLCLSVSMSLPHYPVYNL